MTPESVLLIVEQRATAPATTGIVRRLRQLTVVGGATNLGMSISLSTDAPLAYLDESGRTDPRHFKMHTVVVRPNIVP